MRIMVTGSREWRDIVAIGDALDRVANNSDDDRHTLLHGCASGADAIARSLAFAKDWDILDFWPDYARHDFAKANKLRNLEMVASYPDIVLAFPMPGSRGTWHAVDAAKKAGIKVNLYSQDQ